MSRKSSNIYVTHTGMVINPTRAYPRIAGADVVFSAL